MLAVALAGCRLAAPPSRTETVSDALPKTTTIPPQWSVPSETENVADAWLKTFNDPRLDALVAEALANNLDLRQSAAKVEAARQTVAVVASRLKPQIGFQLGAGTTVDDGPGGASSGTSVLIGVAWEPDIWGRIRAQRAASQAGYEATALDYAWARQSLAATTAKTWYLAVESHQLLVFATSVVGIYRELQELVTVRRAAGKISDLDVAEAGASLNTAESQLRGAEIRNRDVSRALELLLGRYPGAEIEVAAEFVPVPPPVAAGLPASLIERRPDVLAAEQQVLQAFRHEEAAKLARLPNFSLGLGGGRLDNGVLSLLDLNPWLARAAVGMSVPIYTGGELTARIKIADARQVEAIAAYGNAVLQAYREAETALTNEALLAQRLAFDQAAERDRIEAVRVSRIQYKAGATDLLSVLQLQADQIASAIRVIQLRNAQLANRINLHLALGGSFDAEPATTR
jgi:NodT family efflux transporter outer membrane factor (OMF) lipoprotein